MGQKFNKYARGAYDAIVFSEWDGTGSPSGEVYAEDEYGRRIAGAHGDMETDCHTVINLAAAMGGLIRLDGNTYHLVGALTPVSRLCLKGVPGKTVLDCSDNFASLISMSGGYATSHVILSSDPAVEVITVPVGVNTYSVSVLYVPEGSGFVANDWIKIWDNSTIGGTYKQGELARIGSVVLSAGNPDALRLEKILVGTYSTSQSAAIRKITFTERIELFGIDFIGPGVGSSINGIDMKTINGLTIDRCVFRDWGSSALLLTDIIDSVIQNTIFDRIYMDGLGYSISIANASNNMIIDNCTFRGIGRHYIKTGAGTGSYLYGGVPGFVSISNCYFENSVSEAINTHAPMNGPLKVNNCKFVSCSKGVETTNNFDLLNDLTFERCGNGIEIYDSSALYTPNHMLSNIMFKDTRSDDIYTECDNLTIVNATLSNSVVITHGSNITIDGVYCKKPLTGINSTALVTIVGTSDSREAHITLRNFDIQSVPFYPIHISYCDDIVMEHINAAFTSSVYTLHCNRVLQSDVNVSDCIGYGFRHWGIQNLDMFRCKAQRATSRPVYLQDPEAGSEATPIVIQYCDFSTPLGSGIYIPGYTNVTWKHNLGYLTESSGTSTGTGSEQTIAHGLSAIPTGCKAWIKIEYPVGSGRYITKDIPFDATNVYPTVDNGVAFEWGIA